MLKGTNIRTQKVYGVNDMPAIEKCILDNVNNWCEAHASKQFAVNYFFGGENKDWTDLPILELYENQIHKGKTEQKAYTQAAQDLGRIVKLVLKNDTRTFKVIDDKRTLYYQLV